MPVTSFRDVVSAPGGSDVAAERRSWAPALVYTAYLAGAFLLTWRMWAHPSTAIVASKPPDTDQFAWFLRYEATAVWHGRLPSLVTTAMNAPRGINMMWNTTVLLLGVLLTPVTVLAGPQVSLTVLITVGFAGSAASLFYVLRRYGASLPAAAIGGALYGFSPAMTHVVLGHYQVQFAVLPPLIVDAVLRVCLATSVRSSAWSGTWLGLLVAAQLFIGEEMLFETALAALTVVAVLAVSRRPAARAAAGRAAAGLGIAVGVTLLVAGYGLWVQLVGPLTQHGAPFAIDLHTNTLSDFVTPSPSQLLHFAQTPAQLAGEGAEYVAYLGWPLIVVLVTAAIALWRHLTIRACAMTAFVLLLLSVGAHPKIDPSASPSAIVLPWGLLDHLPLIGSLLPNRLSVVADGSAAALLAFGLDLAWAKLSSTRLGRRGAGVLVACVAAIALLPVVPVPLGAYSAVPLPAGWTRTFSALRLPPGATVLVVPLPTDRLTDTLRWQAEGGQQISLVGGYFEGPNGTGEVGIDPGTLPLEAYLNQLWTGTGDVPPVPIRQAQAALRYWRPAAVVAVAPPPKLLSYLEQTLGTPAITSGSVLAWRTPRPGYLAGEDG